jgi:hypothetical protein
MKMIRCFWLMAMISGVAHGDPVGELIVKAEAGELAAQVALGEIHALGQGTPPSGI